MSSPYWRPTRLFPKRRGSGCRGGTNTWLNPPPPARVTIDGMTEERVAIYFHVHPPDRNIPVEVTPFLVKYSILEEAEVAEAVKHLHLDRSGGPSVIQAENL